MSVNKNEEKAGFRDRLTTIDGKGKRVWIYPKKPKGKLYNYRKVLAYALLLFLFAAPFIKVHGDPLILINIIERKFILFGFIFWPQDFYLFVLAMITLIIFIVLFTVIYGRLCCGWVCPQTIFMEFVFRQIEYWIDGNAAAQRKLKNEPWSSAKIFKRIAKHALFFLFSYLTTHIFLSYILGVEQVKEIIAEGPFRHPGGFVGILAFTGVYYFIFAWFREQVCTIACPYGRLQGVMLDNHSMVVAYDYFRGEPRAPLGKARGDDTNKGDCVACDSCVAVCPTGIDIRNGTQLECINCTACIDACNDVMVKVKKPKGLIRFASEDSIKGGVQHHLNTRSITYSIVLALLIGVVATLFSSRDDFETTILRAPGTLYQQTESDYTNLYSVEVVNKTRKELPVKLQIMSGTGTIKMIGDPLSAFPGELKKSMFLILIGKEKLRSSNTPVQIGVFSGEKIIDKINTTFVGPNNLN